MTNKKYKILLVDDERDILSIIKHGLENEGSFEVDAFHDPEKALSQFKPGKYDLLLLDIRMPKMNGLLSRRVLLKTLGAVTPGVLQAYRRLLQAFTREAADFCRRRGMTYLQLRSDVDLQNVLVRTFRSAGVLV